MLWLRPLIWMAAILIILFIISNTYVNLISYREDLGLMRVSYSYRNDGFKLVVDSNSRYPIRLYLQTPCEAYLLNQFAFPPKEVRVNNNTVDLPPFAQRYLSLGKCNPKEVRVLVYVNYGGMDYEPARVYYWLIPGKGSGITELFVGMLMHNTQFAITTFFRIIGTVVTLVAAYLADRWVVKDIKMML